MVKKVTSKNNEFEKEQFPCAKEWWCIEGFLNTIKNNKKWSFKADLYQAIGRDKTTWSVYTLTLFDLVTQKTFRYNSANDSSKLQSKKDKFYIKFDKSYIKGSYPTYQTQFMDPNININLNLRIHAESLPYWIAQKITDGWLPWGLGNYRYGFIPKNEIKGKITINKQKLSIIGNCYFEHIWGDFSFYYLSAYKRSLKKTISTYTKLMGNWIHHQDIKIPKSIMFSTDNRPSGYDWIWVILDNGWSIFYGNFIFWVIEGPATGILILSKDGIKYDEFCNIHFKYNKMKYLKKYDFYYPTELELIATKKYEKLYLHIRNTHESIEDLTEEKDEKRILGFMIGQVPSKAEGYYFNGNKKISLDGVSKMEFHRLLRRSGHNSIKFNFELSKNCFRILSNLNSHYFGKKIDINLNLFPRTKLKIKFNKINKSQL
jgi:hypothetical protein